MPRTVSASTVFHQGAGGPVRGRVVAQREIPPSHMPFFLEAAILSRMRSPVTSRPNWAIDSGTFSISRPMKLVVLNAWVTDE